MAMNTLSDALRNAMCDALVDRLDAGTINFYDSTETTLLATCTFGNPAFNDASSGEATANSISDDTSADNSGTVAVAVIKNSSGSTEFKGTCGNSSSYDFNFDSTTISSGNTVTVSSMTITVPAS